MNMRGRPKRGKKRRGRLFFSRGKWATHEAANIFKGGGRSRDAS